MKNIIMIIVDCLRAEKSIVDIPFATEYTRKSAKTPYLDHLRKNGTTWTNYNSISSTTTPNFASMFTGMIPLDHGIKEHSRYSLRDGITTLSEILQLNGYYTQAEVTGPLIVETGLDRGFGVYRYRPRQAYLHTGFKNQLDDILNSLKSKQPYFLLIHLWECHEIYNAGPYNNPKYGITEYDKAISNVDNTIGKLLITKSLSDHIIIYTSDHGERLVEDWNLNKKLGGSGYQIHDDLKSLSIEKRPPNRGWFERCQEKYGEVNARIYAHNVLGHGFHLFEDLIHIPLVIAGGELEKNKRIHSLQTQLDMFPTVLDLAGIDYKEYVAEERESLLKNPNRKRIYIEANGSGGKQFESKCYLRGMKTEKFKYWKIESPNPDCKYECLYDLRNDPRETIDVKESYGATDDLRYELDNLLFEIKQKDLDYNTDDEEKISKKLEELGYI